MRTTRFPSSGGSLPNPPGGRPPLDADPHLGRSPGCRSPYGRPPPTGRPLDAGHVTCYAMLGRQCPCEQTGVKRLPSPNFICR